MARHRISNALLLGACCAALTSATASAAVIVNRTPVDFTGGSVGIGFGTQDITFSDVSGGSFSFEPVAVSASQGGAFGYLSFFNTPSTYFDPIRGSGTLTFDASTQFARFSTPQTISYSISPFIIALADTRADGTHYGYGEFSGTMLISYGFESVAGQGITLSNTSLSAVPLPASAPLFGAALLGLAGLGYTARRRKPSAVV